MRSDPQPALGSQAFREVPRPHGPPVTTELLALREAIGRHEEPLIVEERLLAVSRALLATEVDLHRAAARLPALRQATRDELLRRLLRARIFTEDALGESAPSSAPASEPRLGSSVPDKADPDSSGPSLCPLCTCGASVS